MAQHLSAKKRIRRNATRTVINRSRMNRIRTFMRKVESAIASGDAQAAQQAFREVTPELQRAAAKRVLHRNTVSRRLSRISAKIKNLEAAAK